MEGKSYDEASVSCWLVYYAPWGGGVGTLRSADSLAVRGDAEAQQVVCWAARPRLFPQHRFIHLPRRSRSRRQHVSEGARMYTDGEVE